MNIALAIIVLLLAGQSVQPAAPTIKGHGIGETFADFIGKEPEKAKDLAICQQPYPYLKGVYSCQALLDAQAGKTASLDARGASFFFRDSKIAVITLLVEGDFDSAKEEAKKKFGDPTSVETIPVHNGFGAQWTERLAIWDTPALYVLLTEDNNPAHSDRRSLLDVHSRAEHDREVREREAKKKNSLD